MIVLHQGFDNLDIALQCQIPEDLDQTLAEAKAFAAQTRTAALVTHQKVKLMVSETGGRGGYAYRCDTGPLGATWFFKRPGTHDPWGVRVSMKSLSLATFGLASARKYVIDTLAALGMKITELDMSVGRVDYAVDVLAPAFELVPDAFVMHSHTRRKSWSDIETERDVGRSGRTTSVTIGSNPGRQVIIYDKSDEIRQKSEKRIWWDIWNANLAQSGFAPLDVGDPRSNRVWRIELRAYKRHLKEDWNIRSPADMDAKIGDVFRTLTEAIRYTCPTGDSNRARWPDHPLWDLVRCRIADGLKEMECGLTEDKIREVMRAQQDAVLSAQLDGLAVALAGLRRVNADLFHVFLPTLLSETIRRTTRHKTPLAERIAKSTEKYTFIGE